MNVSLSGAYTLTIVAVRRGLARGPSGFGWAFGAGNVGSRRLSGA